MNNRLAINGFLAVTAMAWLGQPAAAQVQQMDSGARLAPATTAEPRSNVLAMLRFSTGERVILSAFRRQQLHQVSAAQRPVRAAGGDMPAAPHSLHPGAVLRFESMREARVLPRYVREQLNASNDDVLDIYMSGKVVRLLRDTREVVDIL